LELARREAERFHHNYLGSEHVLLGLIALGQGVAVNVFGGLGLNLENVRAEVEKLAGIGPDENSGATTPYTPRVKKVLAFAREEAKALHHTYIGTEHLLLGLLREGDGLAVTALRHLGVGIKQARLEILKELNPYFVAENDLQIDKPKNPGRLLEKQKSEEQNYGEDFTPRAIEALAHAREEAKRLRRHSVDTEHVLIGLIKLEKGIAANIFKSLGLTLEKTRAEVEKLAGIAPNEKVSGDILYTPRTKHVLAMAEEETKKLHRTYISAEHLLLGVLGETEGLAAEIFKNLKVDTEQVRKKLYDVLKPPGNDAQENK
jgi:ATP-dependent Clp protease ATP-binding subunit ClpA